MELEQQEKESELKTDKRKSLLDQWKDYSDPFNQTQDWSF